MRMRATIGGYNPLEVVSAFQKAVRRGDEESAMYWASELWFTVPSYRNWLWKRILTIVSEDIGGAEPGLAADIWALYQMSEWFLKQVAKSDPLDKHQKAGKLMMYDAVLRISRAKKSREVDHANGWYSTAYPERLEIPDYAYDMHTGKGKAMGRGLDHFMDVGAHLENSIHDDNPDPYEERFRQARGPVKPEKKRGWPETATGQFGLFTEEEEE